MEYEPKPRHCPMPGCGRLLKENERRCPICFPNAPAPKIKEESHKEPWYCADCKRKFPPEFQECPVCKLKTHEFCPDCGTLILRDQPCPICADEEIIKEGQMTEEQRGELHELIERSEEVPLEDAIHEVEGKPKRGRPPGRKKDARATNEFPDKRKPDGRKNNRPPKAREKQQLEKEKSETRILSEKEAREEEAGITESEEQILQLPVEPTPEKLVQAILKLDLDGKNGLNNLCDRIWIIKYLGLKVLSTEIYHTTNGFHAVLQCDNVFKSWEILLFQTWLGSDFRREMCNLLKIERGTENWNVLFQEKWKYNTLGQEVKVSQEIYDAELSEKVLRLVQLGE